MFKREYSIRSVRVHSKRYLERVRVRVWYSMIFVVSDIFAFEVKSKLDREARVVEMTCFFFCDININSENESVEQNVREITTGCVCAGQFST